LGKGLPEDFPISLHQHFYDCARCQRAAWRTSIRVALCAGIAFWPGIGAIGCRPAPKLTPQQAEGKHLCGVRCAHCHEFNDLNLKKVPPNLHGVFSRSSLPSGAPATDTEVERVVLAGKGMMPSFAGRFTKEQMDALLAYLHTGLRDQQGH
jgi:mono/diheme cytochrome c family protein